MNGISYLLDTNIVLYLLRGDQDILPLLKQKDLYISFITEMELLSYPKLSESERQKIISLLNDVFILEFNTEIKNSAIQVRARYGISLPDSIIIASSLFLNLPLISADKAFQKIKELDFIFIER